MQAQGGTQVAGTQVVGETKVMGQAVCSPDTALLLSLNLPSVESTHGGGGEEVSS